MMEPSKEPISVRITRMNSIILGKTPKSLLRREGLIDSLLVLYDECNNDVMKKDPNVATFIEKFRSPVSEIRTMRVNVSDFEIRKVIGRGHFGEVHLVREKQTGDAYAMKTLRKNDTLGNKRAFFENERDIMATAVSPWITSLQYAFQDMHNLYLVMEFHSGGDLLALLDRFGGSISEDYARFYMAEITAAIRSLHQMGYVHRDIKPDNILIDRCGHIKLADFGSSAKLSSAGLVQAEMPVGTPEYLAPEVLQEIEATESKTKSRSGSSRSVLAQLLPYGAECDFWSLGIVAYEMVFGKTPFRSDQLATTYQHILSHKKHFKYPDIVDVSDDFKDLVSGLITDGNARLTYEHLIRHPFFADVEWVSLRDIVPPHVPVVNGEDDTSNFAEFERVQPAPSMESFKCHKEFSGRNLPFVGFTFAKDSTATSSLSNSTHDPLLERKLDAKKKEIHGLLTKINALEGTSGRKNQNAEALEKRAETAEKRVELIEQDRARLEAELARSRSEQHSLRRALDLEMQETKNMEARAMELIKSAKEKWDRVYAKEHKEKDKKIEQLTDQLTALNTSNNNLISKLHRRDKEQAQLRTEISNLQDLVKEYKDNMAKTRQSQRESVIDVQSRLNELATENHNQLAELKSQFENEARKFEQSKAQDERKRKELERALEKAQEEIQVLKDQLTDKNKKLKDMKHAHSSELKKLQKNCAKCAVWQDRIATLESELSTSIMSFEQHENTIAHREVEQSDAFESVSREKGELQKQLQNCVFKEDEMKNKLASLEKLMQSLEGSITKLEEENSKLREQNTCLVKFKRRSSLGTNGPLASPRASTTTTVTTTTIVASRAEASVEPACNENNDDPVNLQVQFLESSLAKLESQLDKTKEAAILDRQAAQAARTDLWRKEKELADAKLDLRISEREVKSLKEDLAKIKVEKTKIEEDIKKERDQKKADRDKISQLTHELEVMKTELKQDKLSSSSLTDALGLYKSELSSKEAKVKELETDFAAAKRQVKLLELQVSKTDETCHELRDEKKRILTQLDETQRSLQRLEVNSNVLKETCTMLEEQLEDFERLTATHEAKEARLQEECSKLQTDIEVTQNEVRLSRQAVNEEKSLRAQAEARSQILESQVEEMKSSLIQVREQASEYKSLAERFTEQVNSSEEQTSQLEVSLHSAQRQVANLQAEVIALKEEVATQLTRIHTLKETNLRLDQELEESVEEERALLERVERLQSTIAEMEACHSHRQVKSDATLQQQAKLIDYLQKKLEEQGRRKKTLTDKLFGKRDKENHLNSANIINTGMKELESQLLQERKKVQKLTEEIIRSSTRGPKSSIQEKDKEKGHLQSPELEALSPTTAKHLVLSPGSQAMKNQASLQRMHHNIPHRFEVKVVMRPSKCAACQDGLPFGRQAAVCLECNVAAHHRCTTLLPTTCGLPSGFARHFSQRWKKSKEGETSEGNNGIPCSTAVNMEGWMKLPTRGNACWERRYVRLAGSNLLIFAHEPSANSAHMSPIEQYPLCPADGVAIVSQATPTEVGNVAKSDVPYIIKLEVTPQTTCWPGSSQYLMALSANDKEKWMEALKAAIRSGEAIRGNANSDRSRRYCGQVLARLTQENQLDVSCLLHINNQVVLMGTEEGLFSYNLGKEKPKPVKIGGVGSVYQMAVMSQHGIVVIISGKNRDLLYCEYGQLKACAEAAECTQATLTTKPVFPSHASNGNPEGCFQMVATSRHRESATTGDILCAASTKRLVIMKWNPSAGSGFQQLKVLETQEPCSCILLTPHSIIVGCNKFFEIDAQDFSVEDFLDVSDKSLSQLITHAKKNNSFPLAIVDITSSKGRCSPEYLVCFHELGVFVDQYGCRSREDDIKWAHVPFAFTYRKPFLFIFHFASVEVMRLSHTSFTRNLNDSGSTISDCPPSSVIELNNPQYLGDTISAGSVYASNTPANGIEVVRIDGSLACPEDLAFSCASLETASENRDDVVMNEVREECEFSFTSSIVQSLEDESDAETEEIRSSSHQDSESHSSEQSDLHSRHVHFRSSFASTPHTAM